METEKALETMTKSADQLGTTHNISTENLREQRAKNYRSDYGKYD